VDELVLAFIAALSIVTGAALLIAVVRGGTLERLREILGAPRGADLEAAARRALDDRETAEWEAGRAAADTTYLLDLVGAGIIRLDPDLRVAATIGSNHWPAEPTKSAGRTGKSRGATGSRR